MDRRFFVGAVLFVAVVFGMVFSAWALGEREVIFPEAAALGLGCFVAPRLPWNASLPRMVAGISACAVLGVLVVVLLPLPRWAQFTAAFAAAQLVLLVSRTTFAPMVSAACLPVLLQTRSPVYVAAAVSLAVVVAVLRLVLERLSLAERREFVRAPLPPRGFFPAFAYRTALVAAGSFLCLRLGAAFCVAPPLLVAFVELSSGSGWTLRRISAASALVVLCALSGAAARYALSVAAGLPVFVPAAASALAAAALSRLLSAPFPPAAAMGILPMLVDEGRLFSYPPSVLAGTAAVALASALWRRISGAE